MRTQRILIPLIVTMVAVLACAGGAATATLSGPRTLFEDDFSSSSSGWTTGSGEHGSIDYVADEYAMEVTETNWLVWGVPGQDDLGSVHVEVTAIDVGEATDAGFGIVCHYQDDQNFYYLGIGSDGFYAIAKFVEDEPSFLNAADSWTESDVIEQGAGSYRLAADCGNGRLTLYVDGREVDSVTDDSFEAGDVGLFVLSAEQPNAEIHFDDFVVTELQ